MTTNSGPSQIATIGIDTGKNTLHMIGLDRRGKIVLQQKMSRRQAVTRFANLPPYLRPDPRSLELMQKNQPQQAINDTPPRP